MMARAWAFGSTAKRCSYQPIASASSFSEAIICAKVRVCCGSSFACSWYSSSSMGGFLSSLLLIRHQRVGRELHVLSGISQHGRWSALNCPQRTQGGSLRVCQSPDPRDIEALVGAVGGQRAQQLSALDAPYLDGIVIPTTGNE